MVAEPVGDLARALISAHASMFEANSRLVDLLYTVIPGWRLTFPANWVWTPPDMLDVWECFPSMPAVKALHAAGFIGGVCLHDHTPEKFLTCRCRRYEPG